MYEVGKEASHANAGGCSRHSSRLSNRHASSRRTHGRVPAGQSKTSIESSERLATKVSVCLLEKSHGVKVIDLLFCKSKGKTCKRHRYAIGRMPCIG